VGVRTPLTSGRADDQAFRRCAVTLPRADVPDRRRTLAASATGGAGLMAGVDQVVFHQLLGWHHLYDGSTRRIGVLTDGLLHAAELAVLLTALVLLVRLAQRGTLAPRSAVAGLMLGAGGFQLFDGLVDHKLLGLHQVRYGVEHLLPYDLAWNAAGAVLLAGGLLLLRRSRREGLS
jgi:uncharacterized membrane protein